MINFLRNLKRRLLGSENNIEFIINVVFSITIKGLAMVVSILIIPAYLDYFNNDTIYGAWITMASVFNMIVVLDFGVGNGLRNYLVKFIEDNNKKKIKEYISSSYFSIGIISIIFLFIGLTIIMLVDWNAFLKIPSNLIDNYSLIKFIAIVYIGVIIHFFFQIINSIYYAMQKTFIPSLLTLITQIILYIFLLIPNNSNNAFKILQLSYLYLIAYNIPLVIVTFILFMGKHKDSRPSLKCISKLASKKVLSLGGMFFIIQIASIFLFSTNEIYITRFFNVGDVVSYQYYHKLYYMIITFLILFIQPLWSAITKAYTNERINWIKKIRSIFNILVFIFIFASIVLTIFLQFIIDIWVGKEVFEVSILTSIIFFLLTSLTLFTTFENSFSNGLGLLKSQMICTVIGALLKLPLVYLLLIFIDDWSVIILANAISLIPLLIVQHIVNNKLINKLIIKQNSKGSIYEFNI